MGWWSQEPRADATEHDAQAAIASIFEPRHRALSASAPPPTLQGSSAAASPGSAGTSATPSTLNRGRDEEGEEGAFIAPPSAWQRWRSGVQAWLPLPVTASDGTAATAVPAHLPEPAAPPTLTSSSSRAAALPPGDAASGVLPWEQLPPSPLAGYELTKDGLVDRLRRPPHTLSAPELTVLIAELTAVEQRAKYNVDRQFAGHLGGRGLHGLELVVNPCLFLASIYLMTWKSVQLYQSALPQDSVVFTRVLALLRRRLPAGERERLAQRHRRLMRATNARVALSFLSGAGLFGLAWVSRPSRTVMEDAPDMMAARDMVAYQRHTEASLKWCWYVYYHHPAYSPGTGKTGR